MNKGDLALLLRKIRSLVREHHRSTVGDGGMHAGTCACGGPGNGGTEECQAWDVIEWLAKQGLQRQHDAEQRRS
jgi:hypothetical protein